MKQGWEIKKLGDVAVVSSGNSAPQKKELFDNGTYPFIRTSDVGKIRKGFISSCVDYLNIEGIKGLKLYKKGTILFPKSGASTFLNHRVMMEIDSYVSSHLATIKGNDSITDDRYLLYFLTTIDARNLMQDIAYPSLKTSDISLIPIPLPPLPEQQSIVVILDDAFAAIAKAKANAEQNLKNAAALFESYLQGVFENKGEGWKEKTLGEICEIDPKKSELKGLDVNHLVSFLPMKDLGILQNQIIPIDTRKLSEVIGSYTYFRDRDVLLAKVTPCFENGKLGIAEKLTNGIGFGSSEYIVFRPLNNVISEYIFYLLSSNKFRNDGKKLMFGTTGLKRLSKDYVKTFLILLPSIKEQQTIVQKLDTLSAETKKLEAIYQQKINDLEELKKSVLQKAFAGQLIMDN